MSNLHNSNKTQTLKIQPKMKGWLITYILFSMPGFLTGLVGLVIIIILFFGVIGLFSAGEEESDILLTKQTSQVGDGDNNILVYNLNGIIQPGDSTTPAYFRESGIYTSVIKEDFAKIRDLENLKAVVFRLNTPGGVVISSEVLGQEIQNLLTDIGQEEAVYNFDRVAASGGLWAAYSTPNNYIYGSKFGLTGSIGVIQTIPNLTGLAEKIGYSQTIISAGENKAYGDLFTDLTQEQIDFLQSQADSAYNSFVDKIVAGRKIPREKVLEIANGFAYENKEAKELGLIDEVGSIDKAIARAAKNAGVENNYQVLGIESEEPFLNNFLATNSLTSSLGLVQTNKLAEQVFQLEPGKIYAIDPLRANI